MRFLTLLFICFILALPTVTAQRLDFTHLSVENGLPQKSVLAITQDSRGFLWFGTAHGLCRFDSRTFKTYIDGLSPANLSSAYILSLLSDSQQNLWVGTSNGLNIYRPQTDDFQHIILNNKTANGRSQIINCITEDKYKRMWIGTANGLYLLANNPQHKVIAFFGLNKNGLNGLNVHSIVLDAGGDIWVGTDKGLIHLTPNGPSFNFQTFRHTMGQPNSLADDNVASIAFDNRQQLWVGLHEKGLDRYDATLRSFIHYTNPADYGNGTDNIRKIIIKDDKLWIGTQDGLSTFNLNTQQFYTYKHDSGNVKSLNQNSIYSLYFDKAHTLWVGTYFGGVNIATEPLFNVYQTTNTIAGISNNVISAIVEDTKHNLWIGTEGGGLNYIHQPDKKITVYQHQKNNPGSISSSLIKTVYQDKDGNIWAGTHGGGLNVLQPGQNSFTKYLYNENDAAVAALEVRAIAETGSYTFWVGTNTGLKVFKRTGTSLMPIIYQSTGILGAQAVNCMLADSKGTLWFGGWGLFSLQKGSNKIHPFNRPIINARINCITEDANSNLWIGTDSRGLFKYDRTTKHATNYTENEGLANNNVYGIIQDKTGNLWISTGNGLSGLNTQTGIFHNYTASDGLAGNEFNKNSFAYLTNGEILFGGFNGYTSFLSQNIKENAGKPAAFITGIKLFSKPVAVGDSSQILPQDISLSKTITLKYTQNVFTLDFVILNYIRAEKNRYAYQVQSIDKNWNYTTIPSATYNNLPPGKYHFLARGQNNDGIWSNMASLTIIVQPPWWRSWWAYTFYLLALAAIIFGIVRYFFLQELLKRDQELTALKLNFFTNISHEIRTYLTLISAPVEKLLMANTIVDDSTQQLQTIKKNSTELLHLVNELMDFRKAETGNLSLHVAQYNIVPFLQSICQSFHEVAVEKNITTNLTAPNTAIELCFDKEQMKKVLFNLLSNAYKFTTAGGIVNVTLQDSNDFVNIQVADNGIGISPENINKLFNNYFQENDYGQQNTGYGIGLALSKSIVALHRGELSVESHIPVSDTDMTTTFNILLKKGNAHFDKAQLLAGNYHVDEQYDTEIGDKTTKLPELTTTDEGKKHTILIVEDNTEVRKFIVGAFNSSYHIIEAPNGRIGFESATEHIPDLIISDVMMPEMDGFTFCEKIKTDERTNHIPVILLTAKASVPNQISGLQKGANVYLTKPFSIQILTLQVQNLITSAEKQRVKFSSQLTAMPVESNAPIENEFIQKIITLAEAQISNPDFDVEMICRHVAMSQTVLYKKLKALTNLNLNDIIKEVRFKKAAELIREQKYTVYEVADRVGYNDTKYFSREFKKHFGVTPRDYKQT